MDLIVVQGDLASIAAENYGNGRDQVYKKVTLCIPSMGISQATTGTSTSGSHYARPKEYIFIRGSPKSPESSRGIILIGPYGTGKRERSIVVIARCTRCMRHTSRCSPEEPLPCILTSITSCQTVATLLCQACHKVCPS